MYSANYINVNSNLPTRSRWMLILFSTLLMSTVANSNLNKPDLNVVKEDRSIDSLSTTNIEGKAKEVTSTKQFEEISSYDNGIHWHNLNVFVKHKGINQSSVNLLHKCSGLVANGHICGIIGPSGAGKSTLLSAIAGLSSGCSVSGTIWLTEKSKEKVEGDKTTASFLAMGDGEIAFLQQDDVFFTQLSPRETLEIAAFLQLPHMSIKDRHDSVNRIIDSLGLSSVQHRRVGDRRQGSGAPSSLLGGSSAGLSGGERRRLSVALELITKPKIFLADEPTTGLDSTQADKVVNLIRKLANERNIPCICSLHQPHASIWKKLDSFILMAPGGKMCFMGNRKHAVEYFSKLGFTCPQETNPAEYFIDLVSIDTEDLIQAAKDIERIDYLFQTFQNKSLKTFWKDAKHFNDYSINGLYTKEDAGARARVNIFKRFGVLFVRAWRQNIRDRKNICIQLIASVAQALLFSSIFKDVKPGLPTPMSIADRTALLSFGAISMGMFAFMKTLNMFGREKTVVTREQMRRQYTSFEYILTKALAELPVDASFAAAFAAVLKCRTGLRCSMKTLCEVFCLLSVTGASMGFAVGSFSSSVDTALSMGVPIMVVLLVVGIINPSGVQSTTTEPNVLLKALKLISPIKWSIEALCVFEYKDMQFAKTKKKLWRQILDLPRMGAFAMVQNGNQVLDALGLGNAVYGNIMKNLAILTGANLLVSLLGLIFFGTPRFVEARDDLLLSCRDKNLHEEECDFIMVDDEFITASKSQLTVSAVPLKISLLRGL